MATKRPELEKFFTDPEHAEDNKFMRALFDRYFDQRMEEERKKRESNETNIFDALFGGK